MNDEMPKDQIDRIQNYDTDTSQSDFLTARYMYLIIIMAFILAGETHSSKIFQCTKV